MSNALVKLGKAGIVEYLESKIPSLERVATKHLTPDRMIRVFLQLATRNPKIYECTRESVLASVALCTATGLEPGTPMKHADLIPRYNGKIKFMELSFQPRYGGFIELGRRSGKIARIGAMAVYSWEIERGLIKVQHEPPAIVHNVCLVDQPELEDKDVIGAYAVAELVNGQRIQRWMGLSEIEKRRACSQQADGNFWTKWYPEMCRKTAIRALFSGGTVPMSMEISHAIYAEDAGTIAAGTAILGETQVQQETSGPVRVIGGFAVPDRPALDAEAEPVDEPHTEEVTPYQHWVNIAESMGATSGEMIMVCDELGYSDLARAEWTEGHVDRAAAWLEEKKGA